MKVLAFESLLASQAKLAKLRELQLYGRYAKPSEFRGLWKTWLGKQLVSFGVDSGMVHFGDWIRELDRLPKSLRTLKVSDEDVWTEWLELTRDPSGRFSTIEARAARPDYVRHGPTGVDFRPSTKQRCPASREAIEITLL